MTPDRLPFVPALPIDADRMHRADPDMVQVILSYVADRLLTPEVPLDGLADREHLDEVLAGLITEEGHDFRSVLDVYANHLALTVLSADSPRMFTFIPSAPTKAALLFDMVVSAASLQGISWFEAAGAVMAENQVLRTHRRHRRAAPDGGRGVRLRRFCGQSVRAGRRAGHDASSAG